MDAINRLTALIKMFEPVLTSVENLLQLCWFSVTRLKSSNSCRLFRVRWGWAMGTTPWCPTCLTAPPPWTPCHQSRTAWASSTPKALTRPTLTTMVSICTLNAVTVLTTFKRPIFMITINRYRVTGDIHCLFKSSGLLNVTLCEIQAKVSKSNYEITSVKVGFQPLISL